MQEHPFETELPLRLAVEGEIAVLAVARHGVAEVMPLKPRQRPLEHDESSA